MTDGPWDLCEMPPQNRCDALETSEKQKIWQRRIVVFRCHTSVSKSRVSIFIRIFANIYIFNRRLVLFVSRFDVWMISCCLRFSSFHVKFGPVHKVCYPIETFNIKFNTSKWAASSSQMEKIVEIVSHGKWFCKWQQKRFRSPTTSNAHQIRLYLAFH